METKKIASISRDLTRSMKKALLNTNWRLMSAGIKERLGYLSGSLKGYESEKDLYNLAKLILKS